MRIYEINAGEKDDITFLKGDPDIDANLQKTNPNLRFKEIIEFHCSDALNAMREAKLPLYRGFNYPPSDAFRGASRNKRKTYTPNSIVDEFNESCAISGFKANRSNSISCTTSSGAANTFGDLFYLFPQNRFNFIWSTKIDDFGSVFGEFRDPDDLNDAYNIDEDETWVDAFGYTDKNFVAALQSKNEISVNGTYIAIKVETPVFGQENQITLAKYLGIR
jgi:hypothetical protein